MLTANVHFFLLNLGRFVVTSPTRRKEWHMDQSQPSGMQARKQTVNIIETKTPELKNSQNYFFFTGKLFIQHTS